MVKMGQSLEKYRDAKLQQFRNQLPAEEAHVRKNVKRLKLRVTAVYIRHRAVLSDLSVSLKSDQSLLLSLFNLGMIVP